MLLPSRFICLTMKLIDSLMIACYWFHGSFDLSAGYKLLKPSGYFAHRHVYRTKILRSAHTANLCVLCGSQNKQRLFPYTTLTDWFV